jgi:hypothetical protein
MTMDIFHPDHIVADVDVARAWMTNKDEVLMKKKSIESVG